VRERQRLGKVATEVQGRVWWCGLSKLVRGGRGENGAVRGVRFAERYT
jgi:hypothetical protein